MASDISDNEDPEIEVQVGKINYTFNRIIDNGRYVIFHTRVIDFVENIMQNLNKCRMFHVTSGSS